MKGIEFSRKSRATWIGVSIFAAWALAAFLAPWWAPYDPLAQPDIQAMSLQPPSLHHWMGTDDLSRDIFSRVLYGARLSLSLALFAVLISVGLGTVLGAVAGYFGGWVDRLVMRAVDIFLSIPRLVLLLVIVGLWPQEHSFFLIAVILGLTGWMGTSRLVRAEALSLKERDFVLAGASLGYSPFRILARHVLPNCMGVVWISATLAVGDTILWESAISFLGLGLSPPAPTWGNMIEEGRQFLSTAPWLSIFPGIAIVGTVLFFHWMGDRLRK